jgi:hypothetical protein
MNIGRNDCQRISRRVALTGTALALGTAAAATAVSQAMAQVKISQATAKYQNTPKGDQRSPTAKVRHGCGRQSGCCLRCAVLAAGLPNRAACYAHPQRGKS